jgi:hypothetical protein
VTADGYQTLTVDDYGPYFQKKGITLVVRLNKKYYDEQKFSKYGIKVLDLYYLDGSNPPPHILQQFLREVEANDGGIAVHCKAGLGRTGTCIGCYFMKHYKMTAAEVIGWLRVCRPGTYVLVLHCRVRNLLLLCLTWVLCGSIIGPQQHFMVEMEQAMWREGDLYRARLRDEQRLSAAAKESESPGVEGVLSIMGNLALAAAPDSKRSKRAMGGGAKGAPSSSRPDSKEAPKAEEEAFGLEGAAGGTTQGDLLRASRAKNVRGASSVSGPSWDRGDGSSRLTRK